MHRTLLLFVILLSPVISSADGYARFQGSGLYCQVTDIGRALVSMRSDGVLDVTPLSDFLKTAARTRRQLKQNLKIVRDELRNAPKRKKQKLQIQKASVVNALRLVREATDFGKQCSSGRLDAAAVLGSPLDGAL